MRATDFRGARCTKVQLSKCKEVARLYDKIQIAYAAELERDTTITEIMCNIYLEGLEEGEFTFDFVCKKEDGELMVRECVFRKKLLLPRTCKLLDASREYWAKRGVADWGIVIEKEGSEGGEK